MKDFGGRSEHSHVASVMCDRHPGTYTLGCSNSYELRRLPHSLDLAVSVNNFIILHTALTASIKMRFK